jgi:hypothetical protein
MRVEICDSSRQPKKARESDLGFRKRFITADLKRRDTNQATPGIEAPSIMPELIYASLTLRLNVR